MMKKISKRQDNKQARILSTIYNDELLQKNQKKLKKVLTYHCLSVIIDIVAGHKSNEQINKK